VNKTVASAAQLAKCILLHAYSRTKAVPCCARTNKNFMSDVAYLTSWHNNILDDK